MADAVATTTIVDGPRIAVIYCTNTSDGTGESAVVKVDVSSLSSLQNGTACTGVRLQKVSFSNVGMAVKILWVATTNVIALELPENYSDTLDFSEIGGLPNYSGSGKTYSVVLTCVKEY